MHISVEKLRQKISPYRMYGSIFVLAFHTELHNLHKTLKISMDKNGYK